MKYVKNLKRPLHDLASEFNDAVAIDLKHWKGNLYMLYMIDIFSRFTLACIIHDKHPDTVINCIMQTWVGSGMGALKKFLADNGREFANPKFTDMCGNLNVPMMNTATESPWQDGLCEQNHAVVDHCLEKIMEDNPHIPIKTALSWAFNAKNSLQMWCGFSSYQFVYGKNPNIPSIKTDNPPTLEGSTISSSFAQHINTLHAAHQSYIEAESSEHIHKALRSKIRKFATFFESGCLVYYNRDNSNKRKGPGIVIGQDGKIILIRHGKVYVRVSSNSVVKAGTEFQSTNSANLEIIDNQEHTTNSPLVDDSDDESISHNKDINENDQLESEQPENVSNEPVNTPSDVTILVDFEKPKAYSVKNDKIEYRFSKDDEYKQVTVLSRGGKATGKCRSFYNIKNEGYREPITVDFDAFESWQKCTEDVNLVTGPAKDNTLQANVFTEIENNGQTKICTRWVITTKGPNIKACLVAKGFQEQHNYPIDSPIILNLLYKLCYLYRPCLNGHVKLLM